MTKHVKLNTSSAQLILDSLIKSNAQVQVVSKRFKLLKITHQNKVSFLKGASFPANPHPSCFIANNKWLTKKVLKLANILTPRSYLAQTQLQARKIINTKNMFPCVLKPSKGAHGNHVYANIETNQELEDIMPNLFPDQGKKDVLIEEFVSGRDYRVMVVGDKISAIMERIPAHVIGDGVHTLRQLITKFNNDPRVGKKYEKPVCKIRLNGEVKRNLKKINVNLSHIPALNKQFFLRQNANISTGGIGKDATLEAPKIVRTTAIKAAKALGMNISGVDILYNPLNQKAYVLELNARPGIDIHHYPVIGQSQDVANDIVEYLLSPQPDSIESGEDINTLEQAPLFNENI